MKPKLKKLTVKDIRNYVPDFVVWSHIKVKKEPVFSLVEVKNSADSKFDLLLALEISLRKCERLGVFRK